MRSFTSRETVELATPVGSHCCDTPVIDNGTDLGSGYAGCDKSAVIVAPVDLEEKYPPRCQHRLRSRFA